MRGKPIAVNSGLTVRHDIKPGSGEDSLVFSGSGLSGPLYLGTTSLHTIFQHMGREAVLRLLGEPELPVGRPPATGTKGWADKMRAMEPLSTQVGGMADQQFAHKRQIEALNDRLQKTEGLLGQALGRIMKVEKLAAGLSDSIEGLEGLPPLPHDGFDYAEATKAHSRIINKHEDTMASLEERLEQLESSVRQLETTVVHSPDSVLHRLQKTEGLLRQARGRIEVLEADWEYAVKDRNDTRQYVTKQRQSIEKLETEQGGLLLRVYTLEAQAKACDPGVCPSCGRSIADG